MAVGSSRAGSALFQKAPAAPEAAQIARGPERAVDGPAMDPLGEQGRSAALLIAIAIVGLPLLHPDGPLRSTPADGLMAIAIVGAIWWAGTHRVRVRFPFLLPVGVLVVTGAVAATFSPYLHKSAVALVQDVFLFAWCVAIANVIRVPENLSIVLTTWAWSATAWASLLIVATGVGVPSIAGAVTGAQGRAQLWFDDPNMAGEYFVISLFVLFLVGRPRNRVVWLSACALLLVAIAFTGSNAAWMSLAVGGAAAGFVAVWRRTDPVVALAMGMVVVAVIGGIAFVTVRSGVLDEVRNSSVPLVQRSLARSPRSAEGRASLFANEFELYQTGRLVGLGPATVKENLERTVGISEDAVHPAHEDYLATLVERGPLGAIGLVLLIGSLAVMAYSVVFRPLSPAFARTLRYPSASIGALVALALFAVTHETLHYRYEWAFFGILAGLYLFGREVPPVPVVGGIVAAGGTRERA
jgi:O-antigen ligase